MENALTEPAAVEHVEPAQTIESAAPAPTHPTYLLVDAIAPNPFQPRREFDDASIQALSESLKANGLLQPVVVTATDSGYQLIAGERRLRAAKLAGFAEVPVIVRAVDAAAQARLALVENIHREDLNPIDRAQSYAALLASSSMTQQDLAALLGDQRSSIANHLRLLDLPPAVQAFIREQKLSLGHAKVLAGTPLAKRQNELAAACVEGGWSVRTLEAAVVKTASNENTKKVKGKSSYIQDLALQLTRKLDVRAEVKPTSKGAGRLVLHYASLDQFDALLVRLGIELDEA